MLIQDPSRIVRGLQKDFTIVGTRRVHGWYAWAIIGIVFGMAIGIVYVATRSGKFAASKAASSDQTKITITGPVEAGSVLYGTSIFGGDQNKWIANMPGVLVNGPGTYKITGWGYAPDGKEIPPGTGTGAVLHSPSSGKLFVTKGVAMDTMTPTLNVKNAFIQKLVAFYKTKADKLVPIGVSLDCQLAMRLAPQDTAPGAGGIPCYTNGFTGDQRTFGTMLKFTDIPEPGTGKDNGVSKEKFFQPMTTCNGTRTVIIRQNVYGDPKSGYEIVSNTFTCDDKAAQEPF